jgi:ribosomal protein L30/L7E
MVGSVKEWIKEQKIRRVAGSAGEDEDANDTLSELGSARSRPASLPSNTPSRKENLQLASRVQRLEFELVNMTSAVSDMSKALSELTLVVQSMARSGADIPDPLETSK